MISKCAQFHSNISPTSGTKFKSIRVSDKFRGKGIGIKIINHLINESKKYGWYPKGLIASPLKGPAGNQEYLLWMGDEVTENFEIEKIINIS